VAAPELWCRVAILDSDGTTVSCWPVYGAGLPDLAVVDRLARLHLDVRRGGYEMDLREVCCDLAALFELAGLRSDGPLVGL
jgi:hypothetical protein